MPGVNLPMSRRSIMLACSRSTSEKAVMEMGVSCSDSCRLRAVTITSSMAPAGAAADSTALTTPEPVTAASPATHHAAT